MFRVLENFALSASEECGCPEETFIYRYLEVTVHEEPDGSCHGIIYGGEWDHEIAGNGPLTEHRERVLDWIDALPAE